MSTPPLKFLCPHCESPLRMLREQVAAQPSFDCPACRQQVLVSVDAQGAIAATASLGASIPGEPVPAKAGHSSAELTSHQALKQEHSSSLPVQRESHHHRTDPGRATDRMAGLVQRAQQAPGAATSEGIGGIPWYLSPTLIAWTAAGGCGAALLSFALWYDARPGPGSSQERPTAVADSGVGNAPGDGTAVPANSVPPKIPSTEKSIAPARKALGAEARDRMTGLGGLLKQQLETDGAFPAGTWPVVGLPVEQRFSWLARLVHSQGWQPVVPVVWDRPWDDPLNDGFVRRRIPELQNPSVPTLTGIDRYPATHYVGVAGVGADAARVPVEDPRAGAFGDNRRAHPRDFADGLSNTMLVAGAQDQLGSWSSGGPATVRSFTREPYINGPDGFGTGQAKSMLVLMADGSVREISAETAPNVVRQMATLADDRKSLPPPPPEVPVAATPPAEDPVPLPAAPPPVKGVAAPPRPVDRERKPRIIAVPVVPPEAKPPAPGIVDKVPAKKADPQAALAVKIAKYRREERVPLAMVLDEVAEMSGLDIVCEPGVLGPVGMLELNSKVKLNLEGTTIRGILTTVLQQVDLSFKVERGQVHIIPATR